MGKKLEHLAIIMDGNGRWAKERGLSVKEGHQAGANNLKNIAEAVLEEGIPNLSVYAFSTENWKRSNKEIQALMQIFSNFFDRYADDLHKHQVKIHFVGNLSRFPKKIQGICSAVSAKVIPDVKLDLYVCFNYGGRDEIIRAVSDLVQKKEKHEILSSLTEETFREHLYCPRLADPDLIIRTAGEMRLSNFWLWQSAYAEFYTTDVYWPDFSKEDLQKALEVFYQRERRFGNRIESKK